ncbi:MAG: WecB/TagA/CpsF family glycosyltransferase [Pseudomonadota bacterium]
MPARHLGGNETFPAPDDLLDACEAKLRTGDGFAIATLNLDHVVKLKRDQAFRDAYNSHSHVTADGHPIVWIERIAGRTVHRVTGADLVLPLAVRAARVSVPIALLGSTEASLAAAARFLKARIPTLEISLVSAPPMEFDPGATEAERLIETIRDSGARLCFIALGAPKQEMFAARAFDALPQVGFASVGAGLDFLSGTQMRAPDWVQTIAAEWLWRLASNPRRLASRYGACTVVLPGLLFKATLARMTSTRERTG